MRHLFSNNSTVARAADSCGSTQEASKKQRLRLRICISIYEYLLENTRLSCCVVGGSKRVSRDGYANRVIDFNAGLP
jgi:hypothetical protein